MEKVNDVEVGRNSIFWLGGERKAGFIVDIQQLKGLTPLSVCADNDNRDFIITTAQGEFVFTHFQDCCEYVRIEDITGDIQDLVGHPLLLVEEVSSEDGPAPQNPDSCTWTFYKFATIKGYVDVRWLGESNGYYSESVDLVFIPNPDYKSV